MMNFSAIYKIMKKDDNLLRVEYRKQISNFFFEQDFSYFFVMFFLGLFSLFFLIPNKTELRLNVSDDTIATVPTKNTLSKCALELLCITNH